LTRCIGQRVGGRPGAKRFEFYQIELQGKTFGPGGTVGFKRRGEFIRLVLLRHQWLYGRRGGEKVACHLHPLAGLRPIGAIQRQ